MKKSLLALAVLGAFASVASAQSSVTLFGVVDVNVRHVKNGDNKMTKVDSSGLSTGRLGFKGVEDLGGGLKAGFELQTEVAADNGTQPNARFWHRRSVVYLNGGFGEVRLGRDYVASFWNLDTFDPFGTTGIGNILNIISTVGSGAGTTVRADNTVAYFLPSNLGGLYGQATIAAGEGTLGNRYHGARIGYAAGPLNVAASYGRTQVAATGEENFTMANIGASWNFGVAKLMGQVNLSKWDPREQRVALIGVTAPLGQGELRASFVHGNMDGGTAGTAFADDADSKLFALGYVYNMSKRTALYGTVSRISNDGAAALTVAGGPAMTAGQKSSGAEVGIRHSF